MIPFFKEDIKVFNTGSPETIVSLVEERVDSAYMQLGAQTAIQLYLQGQTGDYVKLMNGLMEALSDGTTAGLDGNAYPVYGTLTRATYGGRMLAPAPVDFGGAGISLPQLDSMYQSVNYGSGDYEPNVILTTVKGFGYIRNNYQTQQRFQNVKVGSAGFRGLEYNGAVILASRYAPGSYLMKPSSGASTNPETPPNTNGTNDRVATRMFSYATGGAVTAYPAPAGMWSATTGKFGETIWFENIRKPMVKYRTSSTKPFDGSLDDDGFIPSAGNTKLVGKVLLAHNFTFLPGYFAQGYNFQG